MTTKSKVIVTIIAIFALFFLYKFLFIRTVYYEIGGIKIPSRYNFITGTAKPIINYRGKTNLRTVETKKTNKIGLTRDEVIIAQMNWALFEEWVGMHKEYKGWQDNSEIFKKANEEFRKGSVANTKVK